MLLKLLELVGRGGFQSLTGLGTELGVSTGLITSMLMDLERMGYLVKTTRACDRTECAQCPFSHQSACTDESVVWKLTIKGARALE